MAINIWKIKKKKSNLKLSFLCSGYEFIAMTLNIATILKLVKKKNMQTQNRWT